LIAAGVLVPEGSPSRRTWIDRPTLRLDPADRTEAARVIAQPRRDYEETFAFDLEEWAERRRS
jgi:hypothetical protein